MFRLLALIALVPAILAQTPVQRCDNGAPLPTAVYFGGKDNFCTAPPCDVFRGSDGLTEVDFSSTFATNTITPNIRARVFGIMITYQLPDDVQNNSCGVSLTSGSCPLAPGAETTFRLQMPVDPTSPRVSTDVIFTLFGDNNVPIFCYRIATRVV